MKKTKLTKGRLSQLLDPREPFGDVAARNLAARLHLPPGYFESMDPLTLQWAVTFDALPPNVKARWLELAQMLSPPSAPSEG